MAGNLNKKTTTPASRSVLGSFLRYMNWVVEPIIRYGAYISAFMLAAIMFLTFIDTIFGRLGKWSLIYNRTDFFGPIIGGQEIAELFMLIMIVFGLSYCAFKEGHIRVDLIMQHISRKASLGFDMLAHLASFAFYLIIAWQAIRFGLDNITDKSVTTILQIPNTPFNFILALGAGLTALVFLRDFFKTIQEVAE
jgi:TRAP-type C4-dicarboxylate transport system permease small subunit